MTDAARSPDELHARTVICGVVAQAVADAGAAGVALLGATSPEGRLLAAWLSDGLGPTRLHAVRGPDPAALAGDPIAADEAHRAEGRVMARKQALMLAHPACRTVLLLSVALPPERLLPFGDVPASVLERWAGGLALPEDVRGLADSAGGLPSLDAAIARWLDERQPLEAALEVLPEAARSAVADRLGLHRSARRWPRIVPKLGPRTLWIDVFA